MGPDDIDFQYFSAAPNVLMSYNRQFTNYFMTTIRRGRQVNTIPVKTALEHMCSC